MAIAGEWLAPSKFFPEVNPGDITKSWINRPRVMASEEFLETILSRVAIAPLGDRVLSGTYSR